VARDHVRLHAHRTPQLHQRRLEREQHRLRVPHLVTTQLRQQARSHPFALVEYLAHRRERLVQFRRQVDGHAVLAGEREHDRAVTRLRGLGVLQR
jgi:hypothetical protein